MLVTRRGRVRDELGATLVELLVVLVLMGVVGTIALNGLVTSMRVSRQTEARVHAYAELQRGAERISRDVRAACPLEVLEPTRIVGIVHPGSGAAQRATYRYEPGTGRLLSATAPAGSATPPVERPLMVDVAPTPDVFAYFGDDGSTVTHAADVRTVRITLRRDLAEQDAVEVETVVALRNGGRPCD